MMTSSKLCKRVGLLLITFMIIIHSGLTCSIRAGEDHTYLIFQEDFEDPEGDLLEIKLPSDAPQGSGWEIKADEGNLVLSATNIIWAEAGDRSWEDYTFEIKVQFTNLDSGAHINFRMINAGNRYFFRFFHGEYTLEKALNDAGSTLGVHEAFPSEDMWYVIRIVCIGNSIKIFVDGEPIFDYIDDEDPLLKGKIGFESSFGSQIYFDDVRVLGTQSAYVANLINEAQHEIAVAKSAGADTTKAELELVKARQAYEDSDLALAASYAKDAVTAAQNAKTSPSPPPQGIGFSVEVIAGVISIAAAIIGSVGWVVRTQNAKKRRKILLKRLIERIDEAYSHYKMKARECEAELLRLREEVLTGFKDGVLDEDNFNVLNARIDDYMREIREEIEKK